MKRSKHSLSHMRLQSFNMGKLIPCCCLEVLPGDTFRHQVSALFRVTPLVAPVMHPVRVQLHFWFVPNRLLWDDWESFITDPDSGETIPTIQLDNASGNATLALADHLGIGHDGGTATQVVSALPFRAYNKIVNEFYLDQDIDTPLTETTADTDTDANYAVENSRWKKDYFTVARATAQHGSQEVAAVTAGGTELKINELRRAIATQKLREHRNRFGSRYRDVLAFMGVRSSDSRLDRPEYLGGGKQTISFSEVLGTGTADTAGELGALGGHGIAALATRPYKRFFEEHGYVIGLITARPEPFYEQTIPKHFLRSTWDDFYQRELAMMGEQTIVNEELKYDHASPTDTFGYIPRHDDYRRINNTIHGDFRAETGTLSEWHYGRHFTADPALNASFVECAPTDRVYVATAPDELMGMFRHRIAARRIVSKKGNH